MAFTKLALLCVALSACTSALSIPQHYPRSAHHRAVARAAASVPLNPVGKRGREGCQSRSISPSSVAAAPSSKVISPSAIPTGEPTQSPKAKQETPPPAESSSAPAPTQTLSEEASAPPPTSSSQSASLPTSSERASAPSPSSVEPAPSQTSSKHAIAPAPTASPPPPGNGGGGDLPSFMKGTQTGEGTYYHPALGACGITNNDNDPIVAVSHLVYDNYPGYVKGGNPNNNAICGKFLNVNFEGRSVRVQVTDRCEGCAVGDLDFTPAAFSIITGEADVVMGRGRVAGIKWTWE